MKTTSPRKLEQLAPLANPMARANGASANPPQLPVQFLCTHLGLVLYRSECGRHVCRENIQVILDGGASRIAALAYLTGDKGERTQALVHRQLFTRPPEFGPVEIQYWIDPVPSSVFFPQQLVPVLSIVVQRTREWVQLQARTGWALPCPCVEWVAASATSDCGEGPAA